MNTGAGNDLCHNDSNNHPLYKHLPAKVFWLFKNQVLCVEGKLFMPMNTSSRFLNIFPTDLSCTGGICTIAG